MEILSVILNILQVVWIAIPIAAFKYGRKIWMQYGIQAKDNANQVPYNKVPAQLSPAEIDCFYRLGAFGENFLSAEIIDLAVKDYIRIKRINKKAMLSGLSIYKLIDNIKLEKTKGDEDFESLGNTQQVIAKKILNGSKEVIFFDISEYLLAELPRIKEEIIANLKNKNLIRDNDVDYRTIFFISAFILMGVGFLVVDTGVIFRASMAVAGIILAIYGALIPRYKIVDHDVYEQVRGFRVFLANMIEYKPKTAEEAGRYDSFLPYAIVFDLVGEWINNNEVVSGKEFLKNYNPAWYPGLVEHGFTNETFRMSVIAPDFALSHTGYMPIIDKLKGFIGKIDRH